MILSRVRPATTFLLSAFSKDQLTEFITKKIDEFKTFVINKEPFKVIGYFEWGFTLEFTLGKNVAGMKDIKIIPTVPRWINNDRDILDKPLEKEGYPPLQK